MRFLHGIHFESDIKTWSNHVSVNRVYLLCESECEQKVEASTIEHVKLLLSRLQLFRNVDLENPALLDLLDQGAG